MLQPTPNRAPTYTIGVYLLLALRYIAPYTFPIGALGAFTWAGFLAGPITGLVVLGVCLLVVQLYLELGSKQ